MRRSRNVIAVKTRIKAGSIKSFKDIFDHITFQEIAEELDITSDRVKKISEVPNLMTVGETIRIAHLLDISNTKLLELILKQLNES